MATVTGSLQLRTGKRWWFHLARHTTIALIVLGIINDAERAAEWLVRKGMWFRFEFVDGEGRVKSLDPS